MKIYKGDYLLSKRPIKFPCIGNPSEMVVIEKGQMSIVHAVSNSEPVMYIIGGGLFDDDNIYKYFYTKRQLREAKLKKLI